MPSTMWILLIVIRSWNRACNVNIFYEFMFKRNFSFLIDVMENPDDWNDEQLDDDGDESDTALLGTPPLAEIIITPVTLNDTRNSGGDHLKPK